MGYRPPRRDLSDQERVTSRDYRARLGAPTLPEPEGLLDKHGIKHELTVFPGTEHGFAFSERAVNNTLAAEETWDKMFALWEHTLK
jgi:dienelactone hydrolase